MPWLTVKIRVKTDGIRKGGAGGTVTRWCKLKDSNSWEIWSTSFTNLLSVIPAMSGIPLLYVIREVAKPVHGQIIYNDFMEECVACHPLKGARFIADRKHIHQLAYPYFHSGRKGRKLPAATPLK